MEEIQVNFIESDDYVIKKTTKWVFIFTTIILSINLLYNLKVFSKIKIYLLNNIKVSGYIMKINDKSIAYIRNKSQGTDILKKVSLHYIDKNGIENIKQVIVSDTIIYEKKEFTLADLKSTTQIANSIIKYNDFKKPIVNVKIIGEKYYKNDIKPKVCVVYSDNLYIGDNKIRFNGENGEKVIQETVLANNNTIKKSKITQENVIKEPKDKVIEVGNLNPIAYNKAFLIMPVKGWISSPFGIRQGVMHKGIDIAANTGEHIACALDGEVIFSGWQNGYGKVMIIDHGSEIKTLYAHCSKLYKRKGDLVKKGEYIAEVGSTGNSTGPHLHFELRYSDSPKNPLDFIIE